MSFLLWIQLNMLKTNLTFEGRLMKRVNAGIGGVKKNLIGTVTIVPIRILVNRYIYVVVFIPQSLFLRGCG